MGDREDVPDPHQPMQQPDVQLMQWDLKLKEESLQEMVSQSQIRLLSLCKKAAAATWTWGSACTRHIFCLSMWCNCVSVCTSRVSGRFFAHYSKTPQGLQKCFWR